MATQALAQTLPPVDNTVVKPIIYFQTETLLDKRSFMTFGLNAKPNTETAIGYFGTGLKYAIAVFVRNSIPLILWIGLDRYEFVKSQGQFRGTAVTEIKCRVKKYTRRIPGDQSSQIVPANVRVRTFKLPFTTELGKNWDLWQAYRELHSNTLDEQGHIGWAREQTIQKGKSKSRSIEALALPHLPINDSGMPSENHTTIYTHGQDIETVFHNRDAIFLPTHKLKSMQHMIKPVPSIEDTPSEAGEAVAATTITEATTAATATTPDIDIEIYDQPSQFVYYRGIRVLDLNQHNYNFDRNEKPFQSRYTYNLIGQTSLTEDRTIAYPYGTLSRIGRYILQSDDAALIRAILAVDGKVYWEGKIDFDHPTVTPSATFMQVFRSMSHVGLSGAKRFVKTYHTPKPPEKDGASSEELRKLCTIVRKISGDQLDDITGEIGLAMPVVEFVKAVDKYLTACANDDDLEMPF